MKDSARELMCTLGLAAFVGQIGCNHRHDAWGSSGAGETVPADDPIEVPGARLPRVSGLRWTRELAD